MSIRLPEIEHSRLLYTQYGTIYLNNIKCVYGSVENGMKLKVDHGISMSKLVPYITLQSKLFNESYLDSAALDGLFHDIGRFQQFLLTNSSQDVEL